MPDIQAREVSEGDVFMDKEGSAYLVSTTVHGPLTTRFGLQFSSRVYEFPNDTIIAIAEPGSPQYRRVREREQQLSTEDTHRRLTRLADEYRQRAQTPTGVGNADAWLLMEVANLNNDLVRRLAPPF